MTSITHDLAADIVHTYGYDNASRITSFNTGTTTRGFGYDDAGQLTASDRSGTTDDESYAYDDNGNRTLLGGQEITTSLANRVTNDGVFTYTYRKQGNLWFRTRDDEAAAVDKKIEYDWDHRNRLIKVTIKNQGGATTSTIDYTYDASDRRVERVYDANGQMPGEVTTEHFVYDGADVVLRFGDAGELTHRYLYGPQIDQVLADEVFTAGAGGQRVSDEVLWQLADHQGTIRDVVDSTGTLRKHVDYDSFGKVTGESFYSKAGAPVAATHAEAVDQLFSYTGQEWDSHTKLVNYNARWYDPNTGRFLSEDPSGLDGGDANFYRYVGNSPLNATDPSGLWISKPTDNIFGFGQGTINPLAIAPSLANVNLNVAPMPNIYGNGINHEVVRQAFDNMPIYVNAPALERLPGGLTAGAWDTATTYIPDKYLPKNVASPFNTELHNEILQPGITKEGVLYASLNPHGRPVDVRYIESKVFGNTYRDMVEDLDTSRNKPPWTWALNNTLYGVAHLAAGITDTFLPPSEPSRMTTYSDGWRRLDMGSPTTGQLAGQAQAIIGFTGIPGVKLPLPVAPRNSVNSLNPHFTPDGTRVLQNLTNRENALLSTNLPRALEVLEPAEVAAAAAHRGVAVMQYGNSVERLVAREIAADPQGLGALFEHNLTGRGPDFFGRGPLQGQIYDITTPAQVPAHLARPYGQGLNTIIYQRPTGFP
ncbi:MAG: RHS repeat-associated core domain-containing protein [Pirellulales bacterium]